MPTATPSVKIQTKPFIKKIKKWVAAITLLITVCCLGFFIIWWINSECVQGDCVNGVGTYTHYGDEYVGEFKGGNYNGLGTYTLYGGYKYVGEWKDGKPHGQGTLTAADGSVQSGLWKNGEFVE